MAEALLFSNGKRIASELLADGTDRLVGRLKQTAGPAELIDLAVRNVLSRPPDDEEVRILGAYLGAAHRPARGRLPAARLGLADLRRIPIQPLIVDRIVHPDHAGPRRSESHGRDSTPERSAARPITPSTAAASSAPSPPARRRSPRT